MSLYEKDKSPSFYELRKTIKRLLQDAGPSRIRAGDQEFVEMAISFLEADPYFDCSGYYKSNLVRYLKFVAFTPSQEERLRKLVLRVIDDYGPYRGQHVCRVAASVQSPEFIAEIQDRRKSQDCNIRRRADYMVQYLRRFDHGKPKRQPRP